MNPIETDEIDEADSDKRLSMVDEALVAGTIANTNGLLVILATFAARTSSAWSTNVIGES